MRSDEEALDDVLSPYSRAFRDPQYDLDTCELIREQQDETDVSDLFDGFYHCACGSGHERCPGPDGRPLCAYSTFESGDEPAE